MGLAKFTGPLGPPPSFLNPASEKKGWKHPAIPDALWPVLVVDRLLALGLMILQALDVAANVVSETGWEEQLAYWNAGGVKATKGWAIRYQLRTGHPAPWWRAHGNVGTGDAPTVFYRAYDSLDDFLDEWLHTFVPRPGTVADGWLYKHAGELFWAGDPAWFAEMVHDGYKGPVTAKHPDAAVRDHVSIDHRVGRMWAQSRLAIDVDADWGSGSKRAAHGFRAEHGLVQVPDDALDDSLVTALATLVPSTTSTLPTR
jgi:hypothetical protein